MKKIVMAIAAVMVLSLSLLVGCGGGAPETLEGTTWEITKVSANGTEMDMKQIAQAAGLNDGLTFVFENGKVTTNVSGFSQSTDYTYEDGVLTIEGDTIPMTGDTVTFESDGVTITMVKR